jgi:threonine dehydrogenase-like Zn-dependent dehydrogenase
MLALRYRKSVPRYLLMRAGAKRIRNLDTSRFSPLHLEEIPDPELPTPEWVRLEPLLSGICGSDLGTLSSQNSPFFSPITSPPFVLGHELVGVVTEDNGGFRAGERVVLEPALHCAVRGISPPCPYCAAGRNALCVNVAKGTIAPGIEPLACAVHAALKTSPKEDETALVIGAGSVGLFVVAALRQLTRAGRVICIAKHERQREEALRLGADAVVHPKETYKTLPAMLGTQALEPEIGKPVVMGGADKVFECVGSAGTMEDAVRLTRPGGEATLVGMPSARSCLDLSALWYKEVNLAGAYAYGIEEYEGERVKSFELALRMVPQIELGTLVGPGFRLREYREAIAAARAAGREGHVKVVFDHRD